MFRRALVVSWPLAVLGLCPFGGHGPVPAGHPAVSEPDHGRERRRLQAYAAALEVVDFGAVQADLKALMTQSQEAWPADFGHYGPLFVRLAWHCAGSYRASDGRGGCDGARQRFDPERSWEDNTNLDKARALLWPIKLKYGLGLSWGDLIVLAGTTAIESMGGPVLGFCGGRIDDPDGSDSLALGPSALQEKLAPCPVNGNCTSPLGATSVGLIYVNPEGPMGVPLPDKSALEIRDTFGRMNFTDAETVALIGGGHQFGKTHGACPLGAGPSPAEDPLNPWPGKCGTGKGNDTFTSGFEGPWTDTPTTWGNDFFVDSQQQNWEVHVGPGGHHQWRVKNGTGVFAQMMRLTSDMALLHDPAGIYQQHVGDFAGNLTKLNQTFAHAWYKLVTHDMGPATRCVGKLVPPAQEWQHPLPPPPEKLADFEAVRTDIRGILNTNSDVLPADVFGGGVNGKPYYGALFVRLAFRCAETFRRTDYLGGCNGARLRFSPEKDWPVNKDLDKTLQLLQPIKEKHGEGLSWADLIVLAGSTALEEAGGRRLQFCGGRADATDGAGSAILTPKISAASEDAVVLDEGRRAMGLTKRELTALLGGGHSLGRMHANRSGYVGSWTTDPTRVSNEYFKVLLSEQWQEYASPAGQKQYKAKGKELYMMPVDLLFRTDAGLQAIAQEYAQDEELFLDEFAAAWTKLVNADRFSGPTGSVCDGQQPQQATAKAGGFV